MIDSYAMRTDKPGVWSVHAFAENIPEGGVQVTIKGWAATTVDGETGQTVTDIVGVDARPAGSLSEGRRFGELRETAREPRRVPELHFEIAQSKVVPPTSLPTKELFSMGRGSSELQRKSTNGIPEGP